MNRKIDRYASAWAHVALCADTAWAPDPVDAFSRANQLINFLHEECATDRVTIKKNEISRFMNEKVQLWYNHCHSVKEVPLLQQQLSTEKSNDSNVRCLYCTYAGRGSLRSVKDVIPQSRLAKFYGNFYYDEVRERCYTNGSEVDTDTSSEKSDTFVADAVEECWMLPEVENLFKQLTEDESGRSSAHPPAKNHHEYSSDAAAESLWQSLRAPRSRACQRTQSTTNCGRQSDRNVDGSASRAPLSDCRAVHFAPDSACSCYSRAPGSGASYKLTYVPVNKDVDISKNRYEVKTQAEIELKSRICSSRVRAIWPVTVKYPRDSRKIRTRHLPRPLQKSSMRRKSPHPVLLCPKPNIIKNILAHQRVNERPKQVLHVSQNYVATVDKNNLMQQSIPKKNVSAQYKTSKLLNTSQKAQTTGVRIYSSDQELHRKNVKPPLIRNATSTRSLEMRDVRVLLEQLKRRADAARLLVNAPQIQKRVVQLPTVENVRVSEVVSMSQIVRSPPDGEESPKVSPNNIQKRLYSAVLSEKAQGDDGLDQLEKEAIEQYKASDESIDTQYRELERQALEQYSGTSLRGGTEKTKNGKARAAAARRSSKASKRGPRPRIHAGGDLPVARAPVS